MRGGLRLAPWAAIALVGGVMWPVLGSDLSKFLHMAFDNQYGRPPTGAEVNYYSSVSRTDGPLETLARMVASTDYYVQQCQQKPDLYVTRLYEIFVRREPTFEEQRYWVSRFPGGGTDARLAYVRQFCQANTAPKAILHGPSTRPHQIGIPCAKSTAIRTQDIALTRPSSSVPGATPRQSSDAAPRSFRSR